MRTGTILSGRGSEPSVDEDEQEKLTLQFLILLGLPSFNCVMPSISAKMTCCPSCTQWGACLKLNMEMWERPDDRVGGTALWMCGFTVVLWSGRPAKSTPLLMLTMSSQKLPYGLAIHHDTWKSFQACNSTWNSSLLSSTQVTRVVSPCDTMPAIMPLLGSSPTDAGMHCQFRTHKMLIAIQLN